LRTAVRILTLFHSSEEQPKYYLENPQKGEKDWLGEHTQEKLKITQT
jgi:hypothetical protein